MAANTNYGRDLSCTTSIRTGRFVSGPRLVAEALYRRFTTPRGTLRGTDREANYGLDLTSLVGSVQTKSDVAALPGKIRMEAEKDGRVEEINVVVKETTVGPGKAFSITIDGSTAEGPFELQLRVSEVRVELLGIRVEGAT